MTAYRQRKIRESEILVIDALNAGKISVEFDEYFVLLRKNKADAVQVWYDGAILNPKVQLDLQKIMSAKEAREFLKIA